MGFSSWLKVNVYQILVGVLFGILLFITPLQLSSSSLENGLANTSQLVEHLSQERGTYMTVSFLLSTVLFLILMIANKRTSIAVGIYVNLLALYLFLFINRDSKFLESSFIVIRNWIFLLYILYVPLHFLIHGLMRLVKKDRTLISSLGAVSFGPLFFLTNFAYAFVTLK